MRYAAQCYGTPGRATRQGRCADNAKWPSPRMRPGSKDRRNENQIGAGPKPGRDFSGVMGRPGANPGASAPRFATMMAIGRQSLATRRNQHKSTLSGMAAQARK